MDLHVKIWIEHEKKAVFGEGRRRLLVLVDETGSLNKAAKEMKMSYRAAWGKIKDAEKRLGLPLLERKTGGRQGGGSRLTEAGRTLVDQFDQLKNALEKDAQKHFQRFEKVTLKKDAQK